MKRIIGLLLTVSFLSAILSTDALAANDHFYIRRNGGKRPVLTSDMAHLEKHGGYYIDKKKGDGDKDRVIYLTFDAGYENGNIAKILDTLKKEQVPGAFFILSHLVSANTDLVKRMADEGHLVCNHTSNHKDMTRLSDEEIKCNLQRLERLYKEKTGKELARYFRFPEGQFDERSISTVEKLGYKSVFWSFAYADWDNNKQPDKQKAIKLILENTHNGEVILLHPTSSTNAEILGTLIKEWKEMGYRFGTLDELTS